MNIKDFKEPIRLGKWPVSIDVSPMNIDKFPGDYAMKAFIPSGTTFGCGAFWQIRKSKETITGFFLVILLDEACLDDVPEYMGEVLLDSRMIGNKKDE